VTDDVNSVSVTTECFKLVSSLLAVVVLGYLIFYFLIGGFVNEVRF
jgi:hypothetical protein